MGTRKRAVADWKEICARTRAALAETAQIAGWSEKKCREISEKYGRNVGTAKPIDDTARQRESYQNNMATTIKPMQVGQTERVHVKAYAQDNTNNPSQNVDTVSPLTATVNFATIATVAVDPLDNRAFIITAVGPGIATITIDESPAVTPKLVLNVSISAPPADNRRIDFLSADDPT